MTAPLPPDPENMNDRRAGWASDVLHEFGRDQGCGIECATRDLLANIMHWCDRNDVDFEFELDCARNNYTEETKQ